MGETSYLTNVWLPPPETGAISKRCGKGIGPAQWFSGILSLALIGNIILDCGKLKVWRLTMLLLLGPGRSACINILGANEKCRTAIFSVNTASLTEQKSDAANLHQTNKKSLSRTPDRQPRTNIPSFRETPILAQPRAVVFQSFSSSGWHSSWYLSLGILIFYRI
jgi:hypothetical protein